MLELVIAACFAGAVECRDFSQLYDPREVSLMMCVAGGQVEVARWASEHPGWQVRRWRCGYVAEGRAAI